MATELSPKVVHTPASTTVITPVVKRPIWGRILDGLLIVAAFIAALAESLSTFNFTALGLSTQQATWIALGIFVLRFALTYRPIKLVTVKTEPADPFGERG